MNKLIAIALVSIPLIASAGHSNHGNGNGHGHGGGNSGQGQGNGGQNGNNGNNGNGGSGGPSVPPVVVPPTSTGDNGVESKYGASRAIPDNISDPNRQVVERDNEQSVGYSYCAYLGYNATPSECARELNRQVSEVLKNEQ